MDNGDVEGGQRRRGELEGHGELEPDGQRRQRVVEQRAVLVDAADADDPEVDLELTDQVQRGLADDAAVARAHGSAGDDHLELGIAAQDAGDVEVVGDHVQALVAHQRAGDLLGRGADVEEQGRLVGDMPGEQGRDAPLLLQAQHPARGVGQVLDAGR